MKYPLNATIVDLEEVQEDCFVWDCPECGVCGHQEESEFNTVTCCNCGESFNTYE